MEAPISASLGAMGSLLGKLDEILDTEPKDEIRKLREDLEVTRALMLKLSKARDPPVTARYWMKDVRELSYDMEDCIDAETSDWIERMPVFKTLVGEANERYLTYMLEDSTPSGADFAIDYRLPTVNGRKAVVGLDGPIDKLCQPLSDQDPELKVVSIVGVGGIGKTTLAEQLWHKLGGAFQCRAFVQTCKRPDMRSILRSILSQVRPHQPPPGVSDVHKLTQDIHEHLQDKSYFVIIDDLWATSVWEIVNRAFPEGNLGSRIITTTETEDVALACCAYQSRYIFKMEPLSVQHSKELFTSALFWSREKQLDECSQEIMRRCGGLPQAIVSIASILARNQETETVENTGEQWDYLQNFILNDLGADTPFEEILKQVLNLCYNSLPSCLQTCLLYLSVYSENYIIFKEDLTKQWVVEGFICASTKKETMKISQSYFDKLVNMGLIRHIDVKNSDEVLSYAVHHMVHDFITSKSIAENFITVMDYSQSTMQLSDKVRRLSLQFGSAAYATTPASTRLSQVRSLNFIGLVTCIPSLLDFKLLRVLILNLWGDQGSTSFDLTIISELFLLRYLQIICNVIVQLPDQMQGLEHLETLEINARPDQSLSHLRLGGGTNLPHATLYPSASSSEPCYPSDPVKTFELLPPICSLPTWIGKLHKLCTLKIVVRELLKDDISSLGGLPALTVLSLHVRRHTAEIIVFNTAQFAALEYFELKCGMLSLAFQEGAMPNLEMLKVGFNAHKGEQYGHFLVGIEHLSNLKEVVGIIGVAGGAEEPDWTAAESAFKDTILPFPKLDIEVNVKRADWIEEEYGSPENQHLSQEKHPPTEQPGKIKEESYGDIKQNSDSESASALSSFLHPDTKQTEPISRETNTMAKENEMPRCLPLQSLEEMTNNFSVDRQIGCGSYGKDYLGVHKDGLKIVVKILHDMPGLSDALFDKEFYNLASLQHQNIVRLVGYCHETRRELLEYNKRMVISVVTKRALCFPFMENGSLDNYLSDESNGHCWSRRYTIIKGICNGLKYLHEELKHPVFHLDLKPGNILLDENMIPKIADFGLSRLFRDDRSYITGSPIGTLGYLPPEFINHNIISDKLDIFSLGVIITKIIAGPTGHAKCAEMSSEQFIKIVHGNWMNRLQATSGDLLDSCSEQVKRCIEIALSCLEADRRKRPTIGVIVNMLNETETLENYPRPVIDQV